VLPAVFCFFSGTVLQVVAVVSGKLEEMQLLLGEQGLHVTTWHHQWYSCLDDTMMHCP
jgi:hypothetical protein